MTTQNWLRTKSEELRQARCIHGGLWNLCIAALAVKLARLPIPSNRLRRRIYQDVFCKKYPPIDENESEHPLVDYPSLNAVFARGIKPEHRPIAPAANQFICPCDGTVQEIGRLRSDTLVTVKGINYTLPSLLPRHDVEALHDGYFAIFFLSPGDCHRVFCPYEGALTTVTHVPGSRLLVHPPYQRPEFPVFTMNERVILRFATLLGDYTLVLVAGWGVGNITFRHDPTWRRNPKHLTQQTYASPIHLQRGEWVATFELGSTAILLAPPSPNASVHIVPDQLIRYGQPAFSFPALTEPTRTLPFEQAEVCR